MNPALAIHHGGERLLLFIIILIRFDDGKTDPCPSLEATIWDSNLFGEPEHRVSYLMGGIIGSLFAIKIYPLSIDPSSGRDDLAALRGPELSGGGLEVKSLTIC